MTTTTFPRSLPTTASLRASIASAQTAFNMPAVVPQRDLTLAEDEDNSRILTYPNRRLTIKLLAGVVALLWGGLTLYSFVEAMQVIASPYIDAANISPQLQEWTRGLIAIVSLLALLAGYVCVATMLVRSLSAPVTRRVYCPAKLQPAVRRTVHNIRQVHTHPGAAGRALQLQFVLDELSRVRTAEDEPVLVSAAAQRLSEIDRACAALRRPANTLLMPATSETKGESR